jgi:excinuclease ABC subunit C
LVEHSKARQTLTCIYPVQGTDGRHIWYLIRRGVVEHAIAAPRDGRSYPTACRAAREWLAQENCLGAKFTRREETLAIVNQWFRTNAEERRKLIYFEKLPARYAEMQSVSS